MAGQVDDPQSFESGKMDPGSTTATEPTPKDQVGLYGTTASVKAPPLVQTQEKFLRSAPYVGTIAQDISQILDPYISQLTNLGGEYAAEMEYLKPYLNPQQQTFQQVVDTSKAQESPTGNVAVNAADAQLGAAIEALNNPGNTPGFNAAANLAHDYMQSLPQQAPIQSALGYQKYLQTYGGLAPATTAWPDEAQKAYEFITGSAPGSQAGLPGSAASAAAGAQAITNLQNAQNTLGTSSTQGGASGVSGG